MSKVASVVVPTETLAYWFELATFPSQKTGTILLSKSNQEKKNTAGDYEHQYLDQMEVNFSVSYRTQILSMLLSPTPI